MRWRLQVDRVWARIRAKPNQFSVVVYHRSESLILACSTSDALVRRLRNDRKHRIADFKPSRSSILFDVIYLYSLGLLLL